MRQLGEATSIASSSDEEQIQFHVHVRGLRILSHGGDLLFIRYLFIVLFRDRALSKKTALKNAQEVRWSRLIENPRLGTSKACLLRVQSFFDSSSKKRSQLPVTAHHRSLKKKRRHKQEAEPLRTIYTTASTAATQP